MKRATVKEIIAFAFYKRREEMRSEGIEPYGDMYTDQDCAERVIRFFDVGADKHSWEYEKLYEDYKMFQGLCEEINDSFDNDITLD